MAPLRSLVLGLCATLLADGAMLVVQSGAPSPPVNLAASVSGATVVITWHAGPPVAAPGPSELGQILRLFIHGPWADCAHARP